MAGNKTLDNSLKRCSFCGRDENQVLFLIPSPIDECYICDDCVDACDSIINDHVVTSTATSADFKLLTPMQIKDELDFTVQRLEYGTGLAVDYFDENADELEAARLADIAPAIRGSFLL